VIARAQGLVILWIAVALLVAAGTVLVAIGLAGLFRALFADRPWLGDLVAGLVLIGSAAAGWAAHRAVRELSEAKRLERKYADLESKRGART
jgi:membrane protein implicated in regulation of membrane protease activity